MNKQNRILAAVLALQIVVLAIVFWPRSSAAEGELLFGELSADQIVRLTIKDGSGNQIALARGEGGWVLPEAGDFPVQQGQVDTLLDQIVKLRGDRLVTQTSASHKRLKVADEDFERLIEFELQDGARHKLYLGSAPQGQVLHVRADDQDAVYLALGMTIFDAQTEVAAWIDAQYFSVPSDQIVALTLENANGRFELEKSAGGEWALQGLPAGETLDQDAVNALLTRVSSVRMLRPLGREEQASYGLENPSAVLIVQTRDESENESTFVLRVGGSYGENEGRVVKSATSSYYVLVADYVVSDLLEKAGQDLIEIPPTPEPAVEPTPTP
jgi:hypothetical protein